jgi:hypothetical protein
MIKENPVGVQVVCKCCMENALQFMCHCERGVAKRLFFRGKLKETLEELTTRLFELV